MGPGMHIVEESVVSKRGTIEPLLLLHAQELATHPHIMQVAPDWERYAAMEAADVLMGLFMYEDTHLIGYSVNFVVRHMHYSGLVYCQNDVLFLHPAYREGGFGAFLIRETEARAKARGAGFIVWHAKPNTPLDKLLPRMGYAVQDVIHSREL